MCWRFVGVSNYCFGVFAVWESSSSLSRRSFSEYTISQIITCLRFVWSFTSAASLLLTRCTGSLITITHLVSNSRVFVDWSVFWFLLFSFSFCLSENSFVPLLCFSVCVHVFSLLWKNSFVRIIFKLISWFFFQVWNQIKKIQKKKFFYRWNRIHFFPTKFYTWRKSIFLTVSHVGWKQNYCLYLLDLFFFFTHGKK